MGPSNAVVPPAPRVQGGHDASVSEVPRNEVLRLYDEGVDAFARLARALAGEAWERPACGEWSAAALTRHVAAVAAWYHEWLDRAEQGDAAPPFPGEQLAAQNELALARLAETTGPAALRPLRDKGPVVSQRGCPPHGTCPTATPEGR